MKKLLFFLAGIPSVVSAQQSFNRWSLDAAIGVNKALNPYTTGYSSGTVSFPAVDFGARYMFNSYAGFRAEIGYCGLKSRSSGSAEFRTNYWRTTLEGVVNLGQLLDFYTISPRLGLLGYAGGGASTMMNDSLAPGTDNGSDEMLHLTLGISPQVRLTDRVTVSLNVRGVSHLFQTRTFDMRSTVADRGLDGFLLTATAGVSVYLGKAKEHVDWYSEKQFLQETLQSSQRRYDSLVAAMRDSDRDGVPDVRDDEPATAEGAAVSMRGVTLPPPEIGHPPVGQLSETVAGYVEFPEKTELFFSVQIGVFREATDVDQRYGLEPLVKVQTQNGETRYLLGFYGKLSDAQQVKDIAFESGAVDAFVVAYYQGKRITIAEAGKLLNLHGNLLLEPAG